MTDTTKIAVTSTAEAALKKLKKAEIAIYGCKKDGTRFIFSVKDKDVKKVFAIFAKPCYNISVQVQSRRNRLLTRLLNRAGLIAGGFLFAAIAIISNSFVFKITVSGSGSYLSPEVKRIIYESGAKEFSFYSGFDAPVATGKILALPQVTFCNIQKRGSILYVDVQVDEEHHGSVLRSPLLSNADGIVKNIVAICGTAEVSAGDKVQNGDTLISAYTVAGETRTPSIAVGYAEIECAGRAEYFAQAESDEALKQAYSSVILESDEIINRSHTVNQVEDGVVYVIDFTYLRKLSINMQ